MKYDLENRLIKFAVAVLNVTEVMPEYKGASHLASQLIRSGTAPSLIYGEALSAESRRDFVHKMKMALKELRETCVCLQIIQLKRYVNPGDQVDRLLLENRELIAIFTASIGTAQRNSTH